MYVDVHHGARMEKAFAATYCVLTPAHHATLGFFPRNRESRRRGQWKDDMYKAFAKKALLVVREKFDSDTVVFQAGATGLNEGPMKVLNFTPNQFDISTEVRTLEMGNPNIGARRRGYH